MKQCPHLQTASEHNERYKRLENQKWRDKLYMHLLQLTPEWLIKTFQVWDWEISRFSEAEMLADYLRLKCRSFFLTAMMFAMLSPQTCYTHSPLLIYIVTPLLPYTVDNPILPFIVDNLLLHYTDYIVCHPAAINGSRFRSKMTVHRLFKFTPSLSCWTYLCFLHPSFLPDRWFPFHEDKSSCHITKLVLSGLTKHFPKSTKNVCVCGIAV